MRRREARWAVLCAFNDAPSYDEGHGRMSVYMTRATARSKVIYKADKVVRCVLTYDDGRPAKKARKR